MFATPKILTGLIVIFALGASSVSAQNCTASGIQTRLNSGTSVGTILSQCSNLQLSDFYGKTYAGGIIVYLNPDRSGRGRVIAATDDQTNSTLTSMYYGLTELPNTSIEAGTGWSNTQNICNRSSEDGTFCGQSPKPRWQYSGPYLYGPYFSVTSTRSGHRDWYLPSSGDLSMAFTAVPSAFTGCGSWWSSSQTPFTVDTKDLVVNANIMLSNGQIGNQQKYEGACIRSFRNFGPWIDSLNPQSQEAGSTITINGSNFGTDVGSIVVRFPNGQTATPAATSTATALIVTVPPGTTTGNLRVVVGGVESNTTLFTLFPKNTGVPVISGFSRSIIMNAPGSISGGVLTVYGSGFSPFNTVTFSGGAKAQSETTQTPTQFNVVIPSNALTGSITVTSGSGHSAPSEDTLYVFQYSEPASGISTNSLLDVDASSDGTKIVAVGENATILVSQNGGLHWADTAFVYPSINQARLNTVIIDSSFTDMVKVIVWGTNAYSGTTPNVQIYTSIDMSYSWGSVPIADEIRAAEVVGGQLLTIRNTNGKETISELSRMMSNSRAFQWIIQDDDLFDSRGFATSPTKTIVVGMADSNWTSSLPPSTTSWSSEPSVGSMRDAAFGKGLFVSVTAGSADRRPTIVYSEDGTTWTGAQCDGESCEVPLQSVVFSDSLGLFLAVGDMLNHYTSVDGKNWASLNIPGQSGGQTLIINRAVALPDGFVMVGTNGYVGVMRPAHPTH